MLQEVNALTEKIQSGLDLKEEDMIRRLDARRTTVVAELANEVDISRLEAVKEEKEREDRLAKSLDNKVSTLNISYS